MKNNRVFLIVLDSFGIGNALDAEKFGDAGANTFKSLHNSGLLNIPTLKHMGLYNIDGVDFAPFDEKWVYARSSFGRLTEKSNAKDTITGHWEMTGIISKQSPPTFPNGFPESFVREFEKRIGRKCICNKPYSGTEVIKDYGDEHLKTGSVILYTSADSVCQLATHLDIISLDELYKMCEIARETLVGDELGVGRVIARPFMGESGHFERYSEGRHDYGLIPPKNLLNELVDANKQVFAVGKINDIFSGSGITWTTPNEGNAKNLEVTERIIKGNEFENGLCFINLVDFDMLYGHRRDVKGYSNCLNEFDNWLSKAIHFLKENDTLIITADHGCDPCFSGSDHTRENVPFLMFERDKVIHKKNLGTIEGFDYITKVIKEKLI